MAASDLTDELVGSFITGSFGRGRRVLDVTDSTNEHALEWVAAGAPEGALVVADHQRAGRGRWGRSWISEPGSSLLFSVVVRPPPLDPGLVTTAAGIALADAIGRACGLEVMLKWPNDVTVDGRKLCGVLVETRSSAARPQSVVVGAGINVKRVLNWPDDVAAGATSIEAEVERAGHGTVPGRAALLGLALASLEARYGALAAPGGIAPTIDEAERRSAVLGREVSVRFADGRELRGRAVGLTETGGLRVEAQGSFVELSAGEIERLE